MFKIIISIYLYCFTVHNYLQGIITSYMRHQNTYLSKQAMYEILLNILASLLIETLNSSKLYKHYIPGF